MRHPVLLSAAALAVLSAYVPMAAYANNYLVTEQTSPIFSPPSTSPSSPPVSYQVSAPSPQEADVEAEVPLLIEALAEGAVPTPSSITATPD